VSSTPKASTMWATMRRSASFSRSSPNSPIASQKRRWSSAPGGKWAQRSAAVFPHQSEKASLEQGSQTLLSVARAM
jgi:hypothetical protein